MDRAGFVSQDTGIMASFRQARDALTQHRSRHRSQSHAQAHEEQHGEDAPRLEHPLVSRTPPELVATQDELASLLKHLREQGRFAFDSEFIGETSYHPQLCLVQIATSSRIAIVDPMLPIDLLPFWQLVCDPDIEKIVHAGEQDLEPAWRHVGQRPANVFDTQVAAGFAAMAYPVSLAKLIQEVLGVTLTKGLTFTQWDARPLTPRQLRYAADDVRYLPAVHDSLLSTLRDCGRLAWALDECESRCDPERWTVHVEDDSRRIRGAGTLDGRQMSVLQALFGWREALAREQNLPPRAVMKDEVLIDMARRPPKTLEKLRDVRGLPRPVVNSFADTLLTLMQQAWNEPVPVVPRAPEFSPRERFAADALFALLQATCGSAGIDPALVCTRQELTDLLGARRQGQPIDDYPVMRGWRRQVVGESLLKALSGEPLGPFPSPMRDATRQPTTDRPRRGTTDHRRI